MSCGERCCRAWGALTPPLSRKRERERVLLVEAHRTQRHQ